MLIKFVTVSTLFARSVGLQETKYLFYLALLPYNLNTHLNYRNWHIFFLVIANSVDPTRLLLTLGASPNIQDSHYKNTALHWAAATGNTAAVGSLLSANADTYIENARVSL